MRPDYGTAALLERLEELGAGSDRDMSRLDASEARAANRGIWELCSGDGAPECHISELEIPGGEVPVPARLYRSRTTPNGAPLVVFFHGGGWALGDLQSYDVLMRDLAGRSRAVFLSVDYRLAPEHEFPAGLEDGLAAVRWAARAAASLGADPQRVTVMGDSAGGNLAAVIADQLHTEGEIRLAAQILLYPVLDVASPHEAYPSRVAFGGGEYLLARSDIEVTTRWYLGANGRPDDPAVSPLLAARFDHLPPTVVLTAGLDPLKDEGGAYVSRLDAAGVPVVHRCFETTIHAFVSFGILEVAHEARAWLADHLNTVLDSAR